MGRCSYCNKDVYRLVKDHLLSRSVVKMWKKRIPFKFRYRHIIILCCDSCNSRKGAHIFSSFNKAKSFLNSGMKYKQWLFQEYENREFQKFKSARRKGQLSKELQ